MQNLSQSKAVLTFRNPEILNPESGAEHKRRMGEFERPARKKDSIRSDGFIELERSELSENTKIEISSH